MGIGASVFLIALGAILTFAIDNTRVGGVIDLDVVGWVLMLAGALGLVITIMMLTGRRRTVVAPPPTTTTYERRVVDDDRI